MNDSAVDETTLQRRYYGQTAHQYETFHVNPGDEHYFALGVLFGLLEFYKINSILDVGAGTGRAVAYLAQRKPQLRVVGVEPVRELREVGHSNGLSRDVLVDGDATRLDFKDGAFDLVCEFGMLHHVKKTRPVVEEMLRVARIGVFISDSNNFGQGSPMLRTMKQCLNALGLWRLADRLNTRGEGYRISEGDGLSYSYSLFNDYEFLKDRCRVVHLINTQPAGVNLYRTAPHVACLAIKR